MEAVSNFGTVFFCLAQISGPFNIQYLAKDNEIKVIECNLRASRSFPFVSKVLKTNFIDYAVRIILGKKVEKPWKSLFDIDYIGVKASQFSFSRLSKADPVLGVDMASTGEGGCIGDDYYEAILKAMLSVGYTIPQKNDIKTTMVHWPDVDKKPNASDLIKNKKIDLVINIPKNLSAEELNNDYIIRRTAIDFNVPLITNARLAFIYAISRYKHEDLTIKSWGEYYT